MPEKENPSKLQVRKNKNPKLSLNLLSSCFHLSDLGPIEFDILQLNEDVKESIGNVDDDDPRSGIGLVLITDVTEQRLEYPSLGAGLRSNSGLASGSGLGHRSRITDSYRSNHTLAPDPANCFNLPLKIHWT